MKNVLLGIYIFALSVASGFVVMKGAGDEPYLMFRHSDAFVQVGLGIALIVLWVQFAAWLVYAAITRRVARAWLVLTVWIVIALFYLWQSPIGYVEDITSFVVKRQ